MRTGVKYRALLTDKKEAEILGKARIAVLGLGIAGASAAEALCRRGVGGLTLADAGRLTDDDVYRHPFAFRTTKGLTMVEAGKRFLGGIDDSLLINTYEIGYSAETAHLFDLGSFSCVVDALGTAAEKKELFQRASRERVPVVSLVNRLAGPGEICVDGILRSGLGFLIKDLENSSKRFALRNTRVLYLRKNRTSGRKSGTPEESRTEKQTVNATGIAGIMGYLAAEEAVQSVLAGRTV